MLFPDWNAARSLDCIGHDAFRFSLAVDLAEHKGEEFAVMVMEAQGWGVIDLAEGEAVAGAKRAVLPVPKMPPP